jgi:histone H3/H4
MHSTLASEMTMIPEKSFRKLVKQTTCSMFSTDLSFRLRTIQDLQQLAEDCAVHLIKDALFIARATHAKRTLVLPVDLLLAVNIRCDTDKWRSNLARCLGEGYNIL